MTLIKLTILGAGLDGETILVKTDEIVRAARVEVSDKVDDTSGRHLLGQSTRIYGTIVHMRDGARQVVKETLDEIFNLVNMPPLPTYQTNNGAMQYVPFNYVPIEPEKPKVSWDERYGEDKAREMRESARRRMLERHEKKRALYEKNAKREAQTDA